MSAISKVVKFLQAMYDSEHFSFNVRIASFCLSEKFASILDRTLILKERCTEATCGGVYLEGDWLCAVKVFKRIGRCDCLLDFVYGQLVFWAPLELAVLLGQVPEAG